MKNIILVDDDDLVRNFTTRILRQAGGYYVTAFSSAEQAEQEIRSMHQKDRDECLVIMDVSLMFDSQYPDGCAAMRKIVREWPTVRSLIVTGHGFEIIEKHCPGMPSYMLKPWMSDQMLETVDTLFDHPPWRPPVDPNL